MSKVGASAYRACLNAQGGFTLTVSNLNASIAELFIQWLPKAGMSANSAPKIINHQNISNISELKTLLGNKAWKNSAKDLEIILNKVDAKAASTLTIQLGDISRNAIIPPPVEIPKVVIVPPKTEQQKISEAFKAGKTCKLQIVIAQTCCFGTIARGTASPYEITYIKGLNWKVRGHMSTEGHPMQTSVTHGENPDYFAFGFWGEPFDWDVNGYATARKDNRVGGQIICP